MLDQYALLNKIRRRVFEEVAKLALQLVNGNNYLTSQIITLDGGWI